MSINLTIPENNARRVKGMHNLTPGLWQIDDGFYCWVFNRPTYSAEGRSWNGCIAINPIDGNSNCDPITTFSNRRYWERETFEYVGNKIDINLETNG